MADQASQLNGLFAPSGTLPHEVLGELQSILRLHSISSQELSYKWESYTMRMGLESTKLELETVRAFKKDLQETLERESRAKASGSAGRKAHATPRGGSFGDDVFEMLDNFLPNTPLQHKSKHGSVKRKAALATPPIPKFNKTDGMSSPTDGRSNDHINGGSAAFAERKNAGDIVETLNDHLSAFEPPIAPRADPRIKITANTDLKKFYYKPMAMHLSEASEVLDDRIDEFMSLVQAHHGLEESAFGSAASQSTNEIVAIGRIACESPEGKLNAASLMLEMSRRTGAGLRIPLKIASASETFFPGQIVALRGINASGSYFSVSEVLNIPLPAPAVSPLPVLDAINDRLGVEDGATNGGSSALNVMISSGPYSADDNLAFEPFEALCEKAADTYADALILIGPMLDIEHPLLASGDFDLPDDSDIEPDHTTLNDVFRILIGKRLRRLAQQVPNITIIMVPSVRDAVNKHVSWPQEPYDKRVLGLPKQVRMVTNPVTISLNETLVGISASDILWDLRREETNIGKPKDSNLLSRLPGHLIQQRHFYPLFPPIDRTSLPQAGTEDGLATGMPLDVSYLKLGEWVNARPDMLVTPSALPPFGKVVEGVVVVNPGSLSKRRGPGTYAQLAIHPRHVTKEERAAEEVVRHNLFHRARIDVVKI